MKTFKVFSNQKLSNEDIENFFYSMLHVEYDIIKENKQMVKFHDSGFYHSTTTEYVVADKALEKGNFERICIDYTDSLTDDSYVYIRHMEISTLLLPKYRKWVKWEDLKDNAYRWCYPKYKTTFRKIFKSSAYHNFLLHPVIVNYDILKHKSFRIINEEDSWSSIQCPSSDTLSEEELNDAIKASESNGELIFTSATAGSNACEYINLYSHNFIIELPDGNFVTKLCYGNTGLSAFTHRVNVDSGSSSEDEIIFDEDDKLITSIYKNRLN